jgi:sulfopropanediol 3-dehydrogenase
MSAEYLKRADPRKEEDLSSTKALVSEILEKIRIDGENGVRYYSDKFDEWNPTSFKLSPTEIQEAEKKVPEGLKQDILFLCEQVKSFAKEQMKGLVDFEKETLPGIFLGQKYIPIESLGVYVPGGRYTLIACAVMSIVPAKVAGVKRIVACAPTKNGSLNPAVVFAINQAGADQIYTIGGAQAIGAMSFGMGQILDPVTMIAGPGNKYVVEAKRQVFGRVGIDLLAGPTEIGIIADDFADPRIVAADIVGQAEHDPDSPQFVIVFSKELGNKIIGEVERQLVGLPTSEVAKSSWSKNGEVIVASSKEEAAMLSDDRAPEHLEIQTKNHDWYFKNLKNYGTLFLGEESTVVYSDKAIGTNHILPTGRASRYTGGLWVGKYIKNVTYQRLDRRGSLKIAPYAARIAHAEGMIAHERSANARIEKYS